MIVKARLQFLLHFWNGAPFRIGQQVFQFGLGPGKPSQLRRGGNQMVACFTNIGGGQFIASATEQTLRHVQRYLQGKLGVPFLEIPRGTEQRFRFRFASTGAFQGNVQEFGVLGRGKPFALVSARLNQVQQDLAAVLFRISRGGRSEYAQIGTRLGRKQTISPVGIRSIRRMQPSPALTGFDLATSLISETASFKRLEARAVPRQP